MTTIETVPDTTTEADDDQDPVVASSDPAESADPAPLDEPTRRPRGFLESDVKRITDKFVTGQLVLAEGASLTPHFIGLAIKSEDGLDTAPSTGAVNAVLKRWVEYGFITASDTPFAFVGYTQAAIDDGLSALKAVHAECGKAARAAAKAAETTADAA